MLDNSSHKIISIPTRMKIRQVIPILILISVPLLLSAQNDSIIERLTHFKKLVEELAITDKIDSLQETNLTTHINSLIEYESRLMSLGQSATAEEMRDTQTKEAELISGLQLLKNKVIGVPVILFKDTLFHIYTGTGTLGANERAANIMRRINNIYDDFTTNDSLIVLHTERSADIVFQDLILMSVTAEDAAWELSSKEAVALEYANTITTTILDEKEKDNITLFLIRVGLVILVITGIYLLIWGINKGHRRMTRFITRNKDKWLKNLAYKDYTFLSAEQELRLVFVLFNLLKWFMILMSLYLVLPLVFSIFPFTRGWANILFKLVWSPFKGIFIGIWDYIPNLFTILVIYFVMKYFIRFVKYIFSEIESEKLKISGFHIDWAQPTYSIVRFLLYAFMFILIFPYLPGSDSEIFRGVSVFLGILFSLGSSTAISNMIAGLVITYMRPFKIGDRIKIGDMTGDVMEKTLLVTRLRTVKNEEITIPNASVLSGNTVNYSVHAREEGLIIHTTVTIGYDVPWKLMHEALLESAARTTEVLKNPEPFVLQTALDDFYVSYQLNAFTHEALRQAFVYSDLHKHIQDVCNERGIEILSPHYRAQRDGNMTTIPANYLKTDYEAPSFRVENKSKK